MITIQVGPIGIAIPEVVNQKSHPTEWRRCGHDELPKTSSSTMA